MATDISRSFGYDESIVAGQACAPGTHWNGRECVRDAGGAEGPGGPARVAPAAPDLSGIDFAGLAAQYPDIFGGPGPTVAATPSEPEFTPEEQAYFEQAVAAGFFGPANAGAGVETSAATTTPAAPAVNWYEQTTPSGVSTS